MRKSKKRICRSYAFTSNAFCMPTNRSLRRIRTLVVSSFAKRERQVPVFYHMFDLSLHGRDKKHQPIHQKYRPKHRNVEHAEEGHEETDDKGSRKSIPVRVNEANIHRPIQNNPLRVSVLPSNASIFIQRIPYFPPFVYDSSSRSKRR